MKLKTAILTAVGMIGVATTANAAQITEFSDRTNFETATAPRTVIDFSPSPHFPISTGILDSNTDCAACIGGSIPAGTIPTGITFSTPVSSVYALNIDAGGGYSGGFLDGLGTSFGNAANPVTISFAAAQSGFGFDTTDLMGGFNVQIFDGATSLGTFNYNSGGFYGFQSTSFDITSTLIEGTSHTFNFDLDNFTFNGNLVGQGAVPEPATWAMMLLGFGMIGFAMRKRSNVGTTVTYS